MATAAKLAPSPPRADKHRDARPVLLSGSSIRRVADLRLLQKTLGRASIKVSAHIYADLYDDELD